MRILHLYRPRLPGTRAQAIQVVHACHALAGLGHEVTLLADRDPGGPKSGGLNGGGLNGGGLTEGGPKESALLDGGRKDRDLLAGFGLPTPPGLHLRLAPTAYAPAAGWWFRAQVLGWWAGPPGVVLARDKRRLRWLLRTTGGVHRHRVVLETHEVDSALDQEAGRDPARSLALERWLLDRIDGLIANCGGTMALWEEIHGARLPEHRVVAHNAVSADRRRGPRPPEAVIRCVGSLRAYKGVAELAQAASLLPLPLELIGGSADEQSALGELPPNVRLRPPVPYVQVPDLLSRSAALLLPLADNLFGRHLTSPLKLWDYLATSVPIVAPDLPTVREIEAQTGVCLHRFEAADPAGLVHAVQRALSAPPRTPFVRTWADRARELLPVLLGEARPAP